jgi:hypothetical protein
MNRNMASSRESANEWFQRHADLAAILIVLFGFLARLWAAHGIFLNPDEALHFRLANQNSLALAYRAGLTASHPPLLTSLLYYWRGFATSELWLRLPSVLAGATFCWMFYKWLAQAADKLTAFIGLLFVAFLPPIVLLAAQVRQYALLLAFLAGALYLLDQAFTRNSVGQMAAFSLCIYLAMLSHYSAFLFAAALGIYALIRMRREQPSASLLAAWAFSQIGGLALALVLYKTHLSKLGAGDSRMVLQGWMSEYFLRHSYFDSAHDNPLLFLLGRSFGVFQYFFGQLAVGDVMGLLFVVALALLLRGKGFAGEQPAARRLGIFLLLSFAVAAGASLAHVYPYGGTRHVAFLIIPGVAGVSVAIARLAAGRWARAVALALLIVIVCVVFGKPRQPWIDRADQSRANMAAAMRFITQNISPSDLIVTDYETDLILGHYLCQQRPISLHPAPPNYEQYSCGAYRLVCRNYGDWAFSSENFPGEWRRVVQAYNLKPAQTVWVVQAGWKANLPEDLKKNVTEFRDLHFEAFGRNIKIFKMTVGQPMPAVAP